MNLPEELLYIEVGKHIIENGLLNADIDLKKTAEIKSVKILEEIKHIIGSNSDDDFMKIEKIVNVFEKYHINCGNCHDFG